MSEKPPKSRMNDEQKEMLVAFMTDHSILVTKKFSNTFTYHDGEVKWDELTRKLNKIGPAKDKEGWKKSWRALKLSAKKAAGDVRKSNVKTGGGSSDEEDFDLTPTKEQVIAISGGQTIVKGNSRVSTFPVLHKSDYRPAPAPKLEQKPKPNDTNSDEEDDVEVIGLPQFIHHAEVHQKGGGHQEILVIPKRKLDFNNDEKPAKVVKRAEKEERISTQGDSKRYVESNKHQTYSSLINFIEVVEDDTEIVPNQVREEKVSKSMRKYVENVEIEKLSSSSSNTSKNMDKILPKTPVNNFKSRTPPLGTTGTSEKNGQSVGKSTYNKKKDSSANSDMIEVIKQQTAAMNAQTAAMNAQTAAILEQTKVFGQFSGLLQDLLNRL